MEMGGKSLLLDIKNDIDCEPGSPCSSNHWRLGRYDEVSAPFVYCFLPIHSSILNDGRESFFSSKGASPHFHTTVLSFPWKATQCVQPCLNTFRWLGKHSADVSSDWAKSSDVKNGTNSLEVIGVLPISATWECCLLFKPDSPTHCKHLHRKQV